MKFFRKIRDNKLIWKVCFIIFLYAYISTHILYGFSAKFSVGLVIFVLGATAFFYFAWDKKLFNKLFWQTVFILSIIWKVGSFAVFAVSYDFHNLFSQLTPLGVTLIMLSIISYVFFPLAGLYYYAFRNDIWNPSLPY